MRETRANGKDAIWMPRSKEAAVGKLADLSALVSKREWQRAAYIALLVKPGKPGRRCTNDSASDTYSIREFTRLGIYGFRSQDTVRAYLRAWEIGGMPMPEWGQLIEVPSAEFPDVDVLYGRVPAAAEEDTEPSEDEDAEEAESAPETAVTALPKAGRGTARSAPTILDQFLKVLDLTDPFNIVHGQDPGNVTLLIKTLESWLESLREAAETED